MKKKRNLAVLMTFLLFLAACGSSKNENKGIENMNNKETINEGVDTVCEVTAYHSHTDKNSYFLKQGDKIAVISPSSYPSEEQRDAVMTGLKELGYNPVEGKYAVGEVRTIQDVTEDLKWALEDPEIKAIYCIRGGAASSEVLDCMGLDPITANGKLIIGFIDISTFLSAWTTCGYLSMHSSMSQTFMNLSEESAEVQKKMMQGEIPAYRCQGSSYDKQGTAEGILIGGNLSVLTTVLSTNYDPTVMDEPFILFLEETEEDMERIHRYLTVLKHMGILDKASGLLFGEWTDVPAECETYSGSSRGGEFKSVADMIDRQFLSDLDVPVAFGFPAGHSSVNYPLLIGNPAKLTVAEDSYTLEWE